MNDLHFDAKLTIEQLLKLLARAKAAKTGERDYLMLLIGVSHGLRDVEICDLQRKNFDMDEGTLTVKRPQGLVSASLKTRVSATWSLVS